MDGQVSGLGTVHPLLTLGFFSTWILPLHVEEVVVIRNGWTPKKKKKNIVVTLWPVNTNAYCATLCFCP